MSSIKSRRKRAGGRAGNAGRRGSSSILQIPWGLTENIDKPTEPLSEEGVNAIHLGAMEILEEIGLEILNREARALSLIHISEPTRRTPSRMPSSA